MDAASQFRTSQEYPMTFRTTVAALTAACALVGGSAQAAVIYSSFGPGGSFDRHSGFPVWTAASSMALETWSAMAFTSASDADVSQISLAVGIFFGDTDMEVSLWSKDLTTQLGTWTITAPSAWRRFSPTTITGISGVHLDAGGEYALVAKATNDGDGVWAWGSEDAMGESQEHTAGNAFDYGYGMQGAFEVQGDVTAVPEPGAWALMIIGFGGAGAVLRARRRRALAA
jgi:hypothetical protein